MKWLATVDNGTSIETCPYFARTITLDATSVMVLVGVVTRTSPGDACTVLAPDVRIVCSHQLAFLQLYEFHIL